MKLIKNYTIEMTEKDYKDILAILAYCSGMASYNTGAPQHELLRTNAKDLWYQLSDEEN